MRKTFLRLGSILALLAVAFGAFGSHGLRALVEPERISTFEIGVRYQFYHALGILLVAAIIHFGKKSFLVYAGWLFAAGIGLFSGSLYLLSLQDIFPVPTSILGPITPIGGTLFIAGWAFLFLSTYQDYQRSSRKS